MKGIIFNLLEEVVSEEFGESAWDELLDRVEVDGAYTSLASYPDVELMGLLEALPTLSGLRGDELLRWFGRASMPVLAQRYPGFFDGHTSTRSFLLTLNNIIHPEVRKLYPGADVPVFDFEPVGDSTTGEDTMVVGYRSARRLCALAEGFIQGAAEIFGEDLVMEQPLCMKRGDERCALVCKFSAKAEAADVRG
ncbi:MAG: heme NO-binding domain-containing protein [Actinomycetota bacterium]